jgi:hypothetical protein
MPHWAFCSKNRTTFHDYNVQGESCWPFGGLKMSTSTAAAHWKDLFTSIIAGRWKCPDEHCGNWRLRAKVSCFIRM